MGQPEIRFPDGFDRAHHYPVASDIAMRGAWANYLGGYPVSSTVGVLGVYRELEQGEETAGLASVDLCEVVRGTAKAFDELMDWGDKGTRSDYATQEFIDYHSGDVAKTHETICQVVRFAMNERDELVQPVAEINEIQKTLKGWREAGVYVTANTSTLEGCELATIRFLDTYLPESFDAMLLPRNYDGKAAVTKKGALDILSKALGFDGLMLPTVHVDDAVHHMVGFGKPNSLLGLYAPRHTQNNQLGAKILTETPGAAFEKATGFFSLNGVRL